MSNTYSSYADEIHYSESETCIGTWVDGKPLYQKVFFITPSTWNASSAESNTRVAIGASVKNIISINSFYIGVNDSFVLLLPLFNNGNSSMRMQVRAETNTFPNYPNTVDLVFYGDFSGWNISKVMAVVQYTKTTD